MRPPGQVGGHGRVGDLTKVKVKVRGGSRSYEHPQAKNSQTILGRILYFETKAPPAQGSPETSCSACDVVVRRDPVELYGGVYRVPASAIDLKEMQGDIKEKIKADVKKAPSLLAATFGDGEARGMSMTSPFPIQAHSPLPLVRVRTEEERW